MAYSPCCIKNPATSSETLVKLAKDEDIAVRENVAHHGNSPHEVLALLGEDEKPWVRVCVAQSLSTPPEALTQLVEDEHWTIRIRAARSPAFLQYRAVQDGICEAGVKLPVEWLQQMYVK